MGFNRIVARFVLGTMICTSAPLVLAGPAQALPPEDEIPEEVLRTEIILEARSPVDGEPISAAEYAELQATLQDSDYPPSVSSDIQQLIFLLRVRRLLGTFIPILP